MLPEQLSLTLPSLLPEQDELQPPVPTVLGSIDYRTWRQRLERIDEILRASRVEEAFLRVCLKRRLAEGRQKAEREGRPDQRMTDGKKSELKVTRTLRFKSGTILAIDRGYIDYDWFAKLTRQEVYFVTRMKENVVYEVKAALAVPQNRHVPQDELIWFPRQGKAGEEPCLFRRVEVWDEEKQESIVFVTNLLAFGATTIAAIFKDRCQAELFFKAIKQNLKIKTFVGTSANAVKTQVWTAPIAMLVVKYLQLKSTFYWSLSNLIALLRQQLFVYLDLRQWLDDPFLKSPSYWPPPTRPIL